MTTEQKLREVLPDELPPDTTDKVVDGLLDGSSLAIDEALEVQVRRVDGDEFGSSHPHFPDPDTIVYHLTPTDARRFDDQFGEFLAGLLVDAVERGDEHL